MYFLMQVHWFWTLSCSVSTFIWSKVLRFCFLQLAYGWTCECWFHDMIPFGCHRFSRQGGVQHIISLATPTSCLIGIPISRDLVKTFCCLAVFVRHVFGHLFGIAGSGIFIRVVIMRYWASVAACSKESCKNDFVVPCIWRHLTMYSHSCWSCMHAIIKAMQLLLC